MATLKIFIRIIKDKGHSLRFLWCFNQGRAQGFEISVAVTYSSRRTSFSTFDEKIG